MTDERFEDLAALRSLALPPAPEALRARVRAIPALMPAPARRRRAPRATSWLPVAAALAVGAAVAGALLFGGSRRPVPAPSSHPVAADGRSHPPSPDSTAGPTSIDGLPVMTVSQATADHSAGRIHGSIALRGYWSDGSVGHSCAAPDGPTGDLEIYCHDGEFGITEQDEPIIVIDKFGYTTVAAGPALTPFLPSGLAGTDRLFALPMVNGQRFPPVPIVLVGHFDDPLAAKCRAVAHQLCLDRFVVERIVTFDPESVPSPEPTPTPTPFPFADPPPSLYAIDDCLEGHAVGFAGWKTLRSLGIDAGFADDVAWIVISKDPMPIGDWYDDPNDGKRYRVWAQRVCAAWPGDVGTLFVFMPGTAFREYPNGSHEPTVAP